MPAKRRPEPVRQPRPTRYTGLTDEEILFLRRLEMRGRMRSDSTADAFAVSPVVAARSVAATVWDQGNFTVVRLYVVDKHSRNHELVGVSKRNANDDRYVATRGRKIALARAARGEAVPQ